MEFTGERFIPGQGGAQLAYEHLLRYLFAKEAVGGKRVLDLGSGEGYAAFLLAQQAREVIGVDVSAEAVSHAAAKYVSANLQFIAGSALAIPLAGDRPFDIVVCFEVIEHVADPERLVGEVRRVLQPDGVFFVSTPNRKTYSEDRHTANPFHVREFHFHEFRTLLRRQFKHVEFYGQQITSGASLWNLDPSLPSPRIGDAVIEITPEQLMSVRPVQGAWQEPAYFLAVCSDQPIPKTLSYRSMYLNDMSRLMHKEFEASKAHWLNEVEVLRRRLDQTQAEAQAQAAALEDSLQARLGEKARESDLLRTELERQRQAVETLRRQIIQPEEAVQALQRQVAEKGREARALEARIAGQEQAERTLQAQFAARERALEENLGHVSRDLQVLLRSRSWRLTAPLRWLASRISSGRATLFSNSETLGQIPGPLRGAGDRRYRTDIEPLTLKYNTPHEVDAGRQDPREAIRWIAPVTIAGDTRDSLLTHPPAWITHRLALPPRPTFRAFVALHPDMWQRNQGGLEFRIFALSRSGGRSVARSLRIHPARHPHHRRWIEFVVDLDEVAGQEVDLTLSASVPSGATAEFAWAIWGEPMILSRKSFFAAASQPASPPGQVTGRTLALDESALRTRLDQFLSQPSAQLVFPTVDDPLVSIVISTFNRAEYLYQCLEEIRTHTDVPYELIVVDDASTDATATLLGKCRGVRVIENEQNLEFVGSYNRGAGLAKGRHILLLNNDIIVTPRWLSTLLQTMSAHPECGAVGAKMVRPDGTLQEAGSIVWQDGSALGYGRDRDPHDPEYAYVREVDYCSAACLLVRADLFRQLGGFDERYRPAYYEDADLCFGIRQLGYRVVFQPQVVVIHYEFASRSSERARALCEVNQQKFVTKWAEAVAGAPAAGDVLRGRDRRVGRRVLIMDDQIPAPYLGSGLPRTLRMLELLIDLGCVVTFVPCTNTTAHQPTALQLQQLGIEVFYGAGFTPEALLAARSGYYDVVIISRPHNGLKFLRLARRHHPTAFLIYDTEAIFCLREFRQAEVEGRPLDEAEKRRKLADELRVMRDADVVITVSEAEREVIFKEGAHDHVAIWGHPAALHATGAPLAGRKDLLFVGGFTHGHPPNTDAVLHFAGRIFPEIRKRLPQCRFIVVGFQPTERVRRLASQHIVVTGFVEDLREYYERCRVFVVPHRFAGGISLKLIEAMAYGLPAVTSTVGARGLDLRDGCEALIAGSDAEFVEKVVRLYQDEALWTAVQGAAQEYIRQRCSPEVMRRQLADILRGTGVIEPLESRVGS